MKRKVLHLIDSGGLYGAERMLISLVGEQIAMGLEPVIFSAGELGIPEKPLEREAKRLGLPLKAWRMKPGFNLKEARKIVQWANDNKFELFHSHGYKFNILLGLPGSGRRVPIITTLHGYVHAPRFSKLWVYELVDRLVIGKMDAVVLVGDTMKRELPKSLINAPNTHTIRNGICIEDIEAKSKEDPPKHIAEFISNHNPIILGVGRLSREKGFGYLLDTFRHINEQCSTAGLLIVGEGQNRQELENMVQRYGLSEHVLLPGFFDNVPALMSKASMLVISSSTEGLPITLLEAMAVQIPVVSTAVGEIPLVLGGGAGGNLINAIEGDELSSVIKYAIENKQDTLKRVAWAYETLHHRFSSSAMAHSYQNLYQQVLR